MTDCWTVEARVNQRICISDTTANSMKPVNSYDNKQVPLGLNCTNRVKLLVFELLWPSNSADKCSIEAIRWPSGFLNLFSPC